MRSTLERRRFGMGDVSVANVIVALVDALAPTVSFVSFVSFLIKRGLLVHLTSCTVAKRKIQ